MRFMCSWLASMLMTMLISMSTIMPMVRMANNFGFMYLIFIGITIMTMMAIIFAFCVLVFSHFQIFVELLYNLDMICDAIKT